MTRLIQAGILVLSFAWFPHSLERVKTLGYDFTIYWLSGRGADVLGWVYSSHLRVAFGPLAALPHDTAFAILYGASVCVWLYFARHHPILSVLAAYPMLLSLELGQITPILAWLCLSPLGSVVAAWFKPYLVVFVVLHAVLWTARVRAEKRWYIRPYHREDEPTVPFGRMVHHQEEEI